MYKTFAIAFVSAFGLVSGCHGQVDGIDVRDMMEEMEYIWVDNDETNSNGFLKGVSPCLNYALGSGEQTSAQRVRFAFHDFVTANVANDTGYVFFFKYRLQTLADLRKWYGCITRFRKYPWKRTMDYL